MKKYNFYAGPAILPEDVVKKAQNELMDLNGIGLSVLEISHRSKDFDTIMETAESKIRELLGVPEGYQVLFLQGGASLQFGMIPMNFLKGKADYVNTGAWAKKAIKEAKLFGDVNIAASSENRNFSYIPKELELSSDASYLHITSNETIGGIRYNEFPKSDAPLIADMSSEIFSRKINVADFDMIYAGAQKNIGPSGVTLVIAKDEFLATEKEGLTSMLQYSTHVKGGSRYNTPPCFGIYMIMLVMEWLEKIGGVSAIEKINDEKAGILYDVIDTLDLYKGTADVADRSTMNVTFRLTNEELEAKFLKEATEKGFVGLKGHRSVGGCRASIYNAMPLDGVKALADFMKVFADNN